MKVPEALSCLFRIWEKNSNTTYNGNNNNNNNNNVFWIGYLYPYHTVILCVKMQTQHNFIMLHLLMEQCKPMKYRHTIDKQCYYSSFIKHVKLMNAVLHCLLATLVTPLPGLPSHGLNWHNTGIWWFEDDLTVFFSFLQNKLGSFSAKKVSGLLSSPGPELCFKGSSGPEKMLMCFALWLRKIASAYCCILAVKRTMHFTLWDPLVEYFTFYYEFFHHSVSNLTDN